MISHRNTLAFIFAGIVSLGLPLVAGAAGDPEAGKTKAIICGSCHGTDGNSTFGEWPKLAGQHENYIVRQVNLFKTGNRESAVMAPMIANVSLEDAADIGAYFAQQSVKPGTADETVVALGERIYRGGKAQDGVPACLACHGPTGRGNPGAGYPAVGGQHATYTGAKLKEFSQGKVWGEGEDANAIMATIASRLSEQELLALASYLEGLH
ncbi:MAG: cytochrome c [Lysobacterales bacterium]